MTNVKDTPSADFTWSSAPARSAPTASTRSPAARTFGADIAMPGQLVGKVLRSPHAHARIISIDTSKAEALPGVKAVITARRLPATSRRSSFRPARCMINYRDVVAQRAWRARRCSTRATPVAAVAATSAAIAKQALEADQGRLRGAAARHRRGRGDEARRAAAARRHVHGRRRARRRATPSNIAKRIEFGTGRRRGRLQARPTWSSSALHHQAGAPGLHRAARLRGHRVRGRPGRLWVHARRATCIVRAHCARLLGIGRGQDPRHRRPRSAAASAARPSSISSRWRWRCRGRRSRPGEDGDDARGGVPRHRPDLGRARRASRSAPGRTGTIVAAEAELNYQAGAFAGSPVQPGCMCAFAPYDLENVKRRRLRRRHQPAEGRGLSRAGRADLGVRASRA